VFNNATPSVMAKCNDGFHGKWTDMFCTPNYVAYDFHSNHPGDYSLYCQDVSSDSCNTWMEQTCNNAGASYSPPWVIGVAFRNCLSVCCQLSAPWFTGATQSLRFTVVNSPLHVNELRLYRYAQTVMPVATRLYEELVLQLGYAKCAAKPDQRFMESIGLVDKSYFVPGDTRVQPCVLDGTCSSAKPMGFNTPQLPLGNADAMLQCRAAGSWLAATRNIGGDNQADAILGAACTHPECWVSLRDVQEKESPTLADMIQPDCTSFGCYIPQRSAIVHRGRDAAKQRRLPQVL